jgi:hypothetical protein
MYELIVLISNEIFHRGVYKDFDEIHEYIHKLDTEKKKSKKKRVYRVSSMLPNQRIVVNFD